MGERTAQILAKSACSDFVKSGSRERTGCELRLEKEQDVNLGY